MNTVAVMDAVRVFREADERLREAITATHAAQAAENEALEAWTKAIEQLHAAAGGTSPAVVSDIEAIVVQLGRAGLVVR